MEGLDTSFGLIPDDSDASRIERAWADECAALGVPHDRVRDGAIVAARVAADAESNAPRAARMITQVLGVVGVEPAANELVPVIDALVLTLPATARHQLLVSLEVPDRSDLLRDSARVLSPQAALALIGNAARTYDRPLSAPLARLLQKLRGEAETEGPLRDRAERSFRSLLVHLVDIWRTASITSAAGSFESMFQQKEERRATRVTPQPLRVVQLALESGAIGNVVWGAVAEQARSESGLRELFEMLKAAPKDSRAAGLIIDQIATPARLLALLREQQIDWKMVDVVLPRMGVDAARPLLDELVEAKLRGTRRELMDRLVRIGPEIGPVVAERLGDNRWYVVRNMISLLREAGCDPDLIDVDRFAGHEDGRVRRETLQLQLESPRTRDSALVRSFKDTDRHVLRTALQAARSGLPESAVPVLAERVKDATFPPEFRVMSLYLLGRSGSILALDTLLAFVQGGTSLFGKPKLAAKSPEMLAALGGLARSWSGDRRVAPLLDAAENSKDEQILNALKASQTT